MYISSSRVVCISQIRPGTFFYLYRQNAEPTLCVMGEWVPPEGASTASALIVLALSIDPSTGHWRTSFVNDAFVTLNLGVPVEGATVSFNPQTPTATSVKERYFGFHGKLLVTDQGYALSFNHVAGDFLLALKDGRISPFQSPPLRWIAFDQWQVTVSPPPSEILVSFPAV